MTGHTGASRPPHPFAHLRIARPTDHLEEVARLYEEGLGFARLAEFAGHEGFDGVVLGHADLGYQLEFTRQSGHAAGRCPSKDHLLVFYVTDHQAWESRCASMENAGFRRVTAWNPYWDRQGATYEDPEGYRVVLQGSRWPGAQP